MNEAITAVMSEVGAVGKDGYNSAQKFQFRSADAVINAVSPHMKKHGVICRPIASDVVHEFSTNAKGTRVMDVMGTVTFRWTGPTGDHMDVTVYANARDLADKCGAKLMTVALRICLLQTLCLPTEDEDPDDTYHEVSTVANGLDSGAAKAVLKTPVDEDALKIVLSAIQTDAKAAGVPDSRVAELASQAGIKGRISACRDLSALQKLSDLVRLENG